MVLCGYKALRDALVLQADAFSGRGAMAVFERFTHGNGEAQGVWKRMLDQPVRQNGRGLIENAANEDEPLGLGFN